MHDLATFVEAFVDPGSAPWQQSTRREMREIQTAGLRPSYGLGWVREPGAKPREVTHFTGGRVIWPSISYDGRMIVFDRNHKSGNSIPTVDQPFPSPSRAEV